MQQLGHVAAGFKFLVRVVRSYKLLIPSIISYMETSKWKPTEEEREVMESVWMQVKGACEKPKEEANAQYEHIKKMSQEIASRHYS